MEVLWGWEEKLLDQIEEQLKSMAERRLESLGLLAETSHQVLQERPSFPRWHHSSAASHCELSFALWQFSVFIHFYGADHLSVFYQALPIPLSHVPKNYMALFCRKPSNLLWDSIVPAPTSGLASDSSHLLQRRGTLMIQKLPSSSEILWF